MNEERILITGITGQIGRSLGNNLGNLFTECYKFDLLENKSQVKLENIDPRVRQYAKVVRDISKGGYDLCLHLAANAHTKHSNKLEYQGEFIRDNVLLTERVSNVSERVIIISSDNVFNGMDFNDYKENDNTSPCNFYGVTKAEAEKIVLGKNGAVIRIQTMIGVRNNLIIDKILEAIGGENYWPFWTDQFVRPAFFDDFFEVVKRTINNERSCVYHVSCNGEAISRFRLAEKILDIHKRYNLPIKRESLDSALCDDPTFPRRLVLDTGLTKKELEIDFTCIDEAIEKHILRVVKLKN